MPKIMTKLSARNPLRLDLESHRATRYGKNNRYLADAFVYWRLFTPWGHWERGKIHAVDVCIAWGFAPTKDAAVDEAQIALAGIHHRFCEMTNHLRPRKKKRKGK